MTDAERAAEAYAKQTLSNCCGTSDINFAEEKAFLAGARWAREQASGMTCSECGEKYFTLDGAKLYERIKELEQMCEQMAEVLQNVDRGLFDHSCQMGESTREMQDSVKDALNLYVKWRGK